MIIRISSFWVATGVGWLAVAGPSRADTPLFAPYQIYAAGPWAEAVATGDLNHDGRTDVALTTREYANSKVFVFLQAEAGGLALDATYTAGTGESVAIADVNGDGRADVIVPAERGLAVLTQKQGGGLDPAVLYGDDNSSLRVATGDFNHDGRMDVAAISWGSDLVSVFLQKTDGTLASAAHYAAPHSGYDDLEGGDVTGDGLDDIVVMSGQLYATPNFSVLAQLAGGGFATAQSFSHGPYNLSSSVAIGDIDGDGRNDVALSVWLPGDTIGQYLQNSSGQLVPAADLETWSEDTMTFADVDGDGRADLLGAEQNLLRVRLRSAEGGFLSPQTFSLPYASGLSPHALAIGDVNGDGTPDAVMAKYNYGLVVLLNNSIPVATPTPSPTLEELPTPTPTPEESPTPTVTVAPGPAREADHVAPKVRVTGGGTQTKRYPFVVLNGTASDDRAVKRVEVKQAGTGFVRAAGSSRRWYQLCNLHLGRNVFFVRAIDSAGNVSSVKRVTVTYQP